LPDIEEGEGNGGGNGGSAGVVVGQARVMVQKSMKSRPGAMKRKEKVEKMERERFNANLVEMSKGAGGQSAVAERWEALKRHVQQTAARKGEFVK